MTTNTTELELTPAELRIKVGVYDDPANAIGEVLDDVEADALQLYTDSPKENPHVTLKNGVLWGIAEHDDGGFVEGPMDRQHLMNGLANIDKITVVPANTAPFSYEKRRTSQA